MLNPRADGDDVELMKKGLLNEAGEQVVDVVAGGRARQASWSEGSG